MAIGGSGVPTFLPPQIGSPAFRVKALVHPRCRYCSYGSVAGHRFLTIALLHSLSRNVRENPKIPSKQAALDAEERNEAIQERY